MQLTTSCSYCDEGLTEIQGVICRHCNGTRTVVRTKGSIRRLASDYEDLENDLLVAVQRFAEIVGKEKCWDNISYFDNDHVIFVRKVGNGDQETLRVSLRFFTDPGYEAELLEKNRERLEAEERRQKRLAELREENERRQLRILIEKYGVPK